jgi:hypothetical protein
MAGRAQKSKPDNARGVNLFITWLLQSTCFLHASIDAGAQVMIPYLDKTNLTIDDNCASTYILGRH